MDILDHSIDILNPVSPRHEKALPAAPRLPNLDGALIGLLHNGKPGATEVFEGVRRALSGRYKNLKFEVRRKPSPAAGAPFIPSLIDKWDAAIVAIGD